MPLRLRYPQELLYRRPSDFGLVRGPWRVGCYQFLAWRELRNLRKFAQRVAEQVPVMKLPQDGARSATYLDRHGGERIVRDFAQPLDGWTGRGAQRSSPQTPSKEVAPTLGACPSTAKASARSHRLANCCLDDRRLGLTRCSDRRRARLIRVSITVHTGAKRCLTSTLQG
jgi:hypothetical protein